MLQNTRHRGAYLEMLISAVIGIVASLVLSVEAIQLAADPDAKFSCDLSATISCSKVALSWQANLFGFPNSFLGLITEPVVLTVAVAGLGGVRFPRWFLNTAAGFYAAGLVFAYWLFYQSYVVIGALCPWCLLITVTTTVVMASLLRVCLSDNTFGFPDRVHQRILFALRVGADIWVTVLLVGGVAALVLGKHFAG